MAYTTINKSTEHFNPKLYSGNGASSQAITGVGHQPDLVWLKDRTEASNHQLQDSVRGKSGSNYYYIHSDSTAAQGVQTDYDGVNTLGTDGFTVGYSNSTAWNKSGNNYVSWNWKAGGGQGSSNTDGSTNTLYTSVNTTAGFSMSTYTGTGSAATIGHGLGAAPEIVIIKCTTATENWVMYNKNLGAGKYIFPNTNAAVGPGSGTNTSYFNNTAPTSSVFSVGNDGGTNNNNGGYVAYCFKEKTGYSKFGRYDGIGNVDGNFVYTGFRPAWIMIKRYDSTGTWLIYDNKRNPYNLVNIRLEAQDNFADSTSSGKSLDFLSNGFKIRGDDGEINTNGGDYIYMAFGQTLVGTNNIPTTAR